MSHHATHKLFLVDEEYRSYLSNGEYKAIYARKKWNRYFLVEGLVIFLMLVITTLEYSGFFKKSNTIMDADYYNSMWTTNLWIFAIVSLLCTLIFWPRLKKIRASRLVIGNMTSVKWGEKQVGRTSAPSIIFEYNFTIEDGEVLAGEAYKIVSRKQYQKERLPHGYNVVIAYTDPDYFVVL